LVTLSLLWRGKVTAFVFSVVGDFMDRKSVRVCCQLALSAMLSWTLIPIANAETPSAARTPAAGKAPRGDDAFKKLNTVPEDGMGDKEWLGGLTRVAREIMAKRPNEDLIICIAGCVDKQDRVVFAQPAEPVRPKPVDTYSDAAPVSATPAAATSEAVEPKPVDAKSAPDKSTIDKAAADKAAMSPAVITPAANPTTAPDAVKPPDAAKTLNPSKMPEAAVSPDSQPAIAPAATMTNGEAAVPKFVPSTSETNSEAMPEDAAPESKPEGTDAAPPEGDAKQESSEGAVEPSGDNAEPK
jgi:hypothetical protein